MHVVPATPTAIGLLGPQEWMTRPETQAIFSALQARGTEVRFVGGCVRDGVAKRVVSDIDIATPDLPQTVIELLENAGIKTIPTGIDHGTITAVINKIPYEITTLRRDVETDGRHAKVVFTDCWIEDAKRRDLTINAMSATLNGEVYDPYNGIPHLSRGYIRFVGLAHERVEEDVLRVLRYFRFYGHYGRPPGSFDGLAACRAAAPRLVNLSGERIRNEFLKILLSPDPAGVALMMRGEKIFDHFLPEVGDIIPLRVLSWLETQAMNLDTVKPDAIRRLAILLNANAENAKTVAERFRLSNRQTAQLMSLCQAGDDIDPLMSHYEQQRVLRRIGPDRLRDLVLKNWSMEGARTPNIASERKQGWASILEHCQTWQAPVFPLKGRDVSNLGLTEGPQIGELLRAVETWWENGAYVADKELCLDEARRLME